MRYQLEASDAFDATWALALAMDNASESLCSDDLGHCANTNESLHVALNCYEFFNDRIECLVNRSLNHLKFEGVSVSVFCECVPLTTFTCMLYSTQYTYPFIL